MFTFSFSNQYFIEFLLQNIPIISIDFLFKFTTYYYVVLISSNFVEKKRRVKLFGQILGPLNLTR